MRGTHLSSARGSTLASLLVDFSVKVSLFSGEVLFSPLHGSLVAGYLIFRGALFEARNKDRLRCLDAVAFNYWT